MVRNLAQSSSFPVVLALLKVLCFLDIRRVCTLGYKLCLIMVIYRLSGGAKCFKPNQPQTQTFTIELTCHRGRFTCYLSLKQHHSLFVLYPNLPSTFQLAAVPFCGIWSLFWIVQGVLHLLGVQGVLMHSAPQPVVSRPASPVLGEE